MFCRTTAVRRGAAFTGRAKFVGATFTAPARFERTTFTREALLGATFEQARELRPILVSGQLCLDEAVLAQAVRRLARARRSRRADRRGPSGCRAARNGAAR